MKKYVSINDIVNDEKYPFTKGQLAYHISKRKENGLTASIRKIGRRIYLREDLLEQWMESHVELEQEVKENESVYIRIDELELSPRAENCLINNKIETIKTLISKTRIDLFRFRNMGKGSIKEIRQKLSEYGLKLKGE